MRQDLYEMEFHYGDNLIGIGYNLTEKEADKIWGEWEELDNDCWCMVVYRMN